MGTSQNQKKIMKKFNSLSYSCFVFCFYLSQLCLIVCQGEKVQLVKFPNTVVSAASLSSPNTPGTSPWTNLEAVTGQLANQDRNTHTNSPSCTCQTDYLIFSNFEFQVKPNSVVHGVELDMSRLVKGEVTPVEVFLVDLKNGATAETVGENQAGKSNTGKPNWMPLSNEYQIKWGSGTFKWGADDKLTPAFLSSKDFGFAIKVDLKQSSSVTIDFIYVNIHFTPPVITAPPGVGPTSIQQHTNSKPIQTDVNGNTPLSSTIADNFQSNGETQPNLEPSSDNTAAIVGGVVGAVLCLCCVAALVAFLLMRRGSDDDEEGAPMARQRDDVHTYNDGGSSHVDQTPTQPQQQQQSYQRQPSQTDSYPTAGYPNAGGAGDDGLQSARYDGHSPNYAGVTPGYASEKEDYALQRRPTHNSSGDLGYADAAPGDYSGPPVHDASYMSLGSSYAGGTNPYSGSIDGNIDGSGPMNYTGAANLQQENYNQVPVASNRFGQ